MYNSITRVFFFLPHATWYTNSPRGTQIRYVVFKFVLWYSNPSRGIQIHLVVFNPSRGIQIRLVVFKSISWYSNPSRGVQIRLHGIQIRLVCKVNSLRLSCG